MHTCSVACMCMVSHVQSCMHAQASACTGAPPYGCTCTAAHVCACTHALLHTSRVCMVAHMHCCTCACGFTLAQLHECTVARAQLHMHVCLHACTVVCMQSCTRTQLHAGLQVCGVAHVCMHARSLAHVHSCKHALLHIHTRWCLHECARLHMHVPRPPPPRRCCPLPFAAAVVSVCERNPQICGLGRCIPRQGGYTCLCPPGFWLNTQGTHCIGEGSGRGRAEGRELQADGDTRDWGPCPSVCPCSHPPL